MNEKCSKELENEALLSTFICRVGVKDKLSTTVINRMKREMTMYQRKN